MVVLPAPGEPVIKMILFIVLPTLFVEQQYSTDFTTSTGLGESINAFPPVMGAYGHSTFMRVLSLTP